MAHLPGVSARPRARTHSSEEPGLLLKHELLFVSWVLHGQTLGTHSSQYFLFTRGDQAVIPIVLMEPSTTVLPSAPNVLDYRKETQTDIIRIRDWINKEKLTV